MHKSIHISECQKQYVQTTYVSEHKEEDARASHHHLLLETYQGMLQAVPPKAVKGYQNKNIIINTKLILSNKNTNSMLEELIPSGCEWAEECDCGESPHYHTSAAQHPPLSHSSYASSASSQQSFASDLDPEMGNWSRSRHQHPHHPLPPHGLAGSLTIPNKE